MRKNADVSVTGIVLHPSSFAGNLSTSIRNN